MPSLTVAVLGTGIMGAPMARNLAGAGFGVRVWNRTAERAEPLAEAGIDVAATPAEAAGGADVKVTMLADIDAVLAAVEGDDGALAAMGDEAVWAQMSTVGLAGIERLASLADERGVAFVDAPVLGSRLPAEKGELVVLAAGPEKVLERCAPVFDAVGSRTMRVGEVGAGTRLKLVVNHWILGIVEGVGETVALAQALDLDPGLWLEAISGGAMDVPYAHQKAGAILEGNLAANFKLVLALKDARLVVEAAERAGMDAALARTIVERFERAVELGHGDGDMAATYFASAPKAGAR